MMQPATSRMYYIAVVCPAQVNEKVLRYKMWMKEQFGCVVALKSPAHITIIPPFWLDEIRENELLQTLQSFSSRLPEVKIQLEGFNHFRNRVLFINVEENKILNDLKIQTENHFMESFGNCIKKDNRPFHPHITIANRDMKPSHFEKAWEYFSKKEFKESFTNKTISLLKLSPGKWNVISEQEW
jgi:2'-5' RNA ligase